MDRILTIDETCGVRSIMNSTKKEKELQRRTLQYAELSKYALFPLTSYYENSSDILVSTMYSSVQFSFSSCRLFFITNFYSNHTRPAPESNYHDPVYSITRG